MTKYITVKLTEDQLLNCMQGVAWMMDDSRSKSSNGYLIRLYNKLRKELNEQTGKDWQAQDPTGYLD